MFITLPGKYVNFDHTQKLIADLKAEAKFWGDANHEFNKILMDAEYGDQTKLKPEEETKSAVKKDQSYHAYRLSYLATRYS